MRRNPSWTVSSSPKVFICGRRGRTETKKPPTTRRQYDGFGKQSLKPKIEERHTNTMNKMHFWAGVLVIAAASSMADAAYQAMPQRTCNDKDFYARHQHSCRALEREYFRAQGSVSDVPYVTVTRDFQAADTGGHVKDPFISLQTREDMERSRRRMPQTYG